MARVWPWLMLAACSSEGSIEILVTAAPDLPVKTVELFVGVHDQHLEQIRPKDGPLADAVWWKRDRQKTDFQPMFDRKARFQLLNGGQGGDALAAFVVVGFDDAGEPIAVRSHLLWTDIEDDQIKRFDFVLEPAQPPPGSIDVPGVQVWGPPERPATASMPLRKADPRACVQIDSVKELLTDEYKEPVTGVLPTSGMIVLRDDPDCDGLIMDVPEPDEVECLANEYFGQIEMARNALNCAIPTTFVNSTLPTMGAVQGCVVGGGTCADGPGDNQDTCSPSAYCAPSGVCLQCPLTGCNPYRPTLAAGTGISCTLYRTADLNTSSQFCSKSAYLDLAMALPALGLACDTARGTKLRHDLGTLWQTALPLVPLDASADATITLLPSAGNCQYDFMPSGTVPRATGGALGIYDATLAVPFGPKDQGRGLLLPIKFHIDPAPYGDCSQPPPCSVYQANDDDPGLLACVNADLRPGTQVRD